jgi:hypothetical protein
MASDVVSWHGRGHSRQSRGRGYNRSPTSGNSYRKFRATNYSRLCWPARALAEALIADPCSHSSIHRRRLTTSTAQRGRWRICIESLRSSPDSPSSFAASRSVAMTRQPSRAKAAAVARPIPAPAAVMSAVFPCKRVKEYHTVSEKEQLSASRLQPRIFRFIWSANLTSFERSTTAEPLGTSE